MSLVTRLMNDEAGVVVSAELVLVLTITVLAVIVGLSEVAVAVNTELNDVSNAFGSISQSYAFTGFTATSGYKTKSYFDGSSYIDRSDDCDCNGSCELVCGAGSATGEVQY